MNVIDFSESEKERLARMVQRFLADELSVDVGRFDAEALVLFLAREIGPSIYNQALDDARATVEQRVQRICEDLVELEKLPIPERS